MKKIYLKVILWIGGVLLFLALLSALFLYINREKIKQIIITEINKQLATEIKVSSIKVNFFSTFPSASLAFDDVIAFDAFPKDSLNMKSSSEKKDTLFYFRKLYLSFDFWDIVSENYEINKINAKDGVFNIRVRQNADVNYVFWKQSQSKGASNFSLSLRKIGLENILFSYRNDYSKQYYEILLKDASARGNFSDKEQKITIKSKSNINKIQIDNLAISNKRDFDFDIIISNNTVSKLIQISKGELKIDGLAFDTRGSLNYKNDNIIDLLVKSDRVRLEDMIKLLPEKYSKLFKDYKGKGELVFDFGMKGKISNTKMPSIKSKFYINNGELTNKKLDIAFRNITLNGDFSNGDKRNSETSFINLDKFYFQWNKGIVKGYGQLFNFSNLSIDAKLDCNLPLEIVQRFVQNKNIKELSGNLLLDLKLSGDLKSLEDIPKQGFTKVRMEGKGTLKSFNYSDLRIPQPITNLSSNFIFNNTSIDVSNLSSNVGKTSLSFNGKIENILPYVFNQAQAFNLLGTLNLGSLNLNHWFDSTNTKKTDATKDTISEIKLPTFFNANFITSIKKLEYKETLIDDFYSRVILLNGNLVLEDMRLKAFGGGLKGKASLVLNTKTPKIIGNIDLDKVEASRFFKEMNEFDQSSITSKNIKGDVSGTLNFSAEFLNNKLDLNKDKLSADIKYKIEKGEIKDVPLLKKLSYFVEESELNNVKFNTIESNLSIQNSCITLDEIVVKSNAINFSFLGKHYLNSNIDYKATIKLSELASKKKKAKLEKQRKEFGDFEEDENSQLTLFVKISGTTNNPHFAYDFKKNLEKTKENLKKDKVKIATSIDKDLRLEVEQMKKDKTNWKIQEKGEYIIEWEEEKDAWDTIKTKNDENRDNQTKFTIEWE
ncbi:MAG: AsmA-like C-terminal region-containing protein [Bacteroidales bacterium]|jgi:hypothetical protein|nr:AsmA-like C-terminal region-containing protein [Bacteroidales bacterium]